MRLAVLLLLALAGAGQGQEVASISSRFEPRPGRTETVLRLVSEEWVRGQLESMQEGDLQLDGDKTSERTYDWKDVLELRSSERMHIVFTDRPSAVGRPRLGTDGLLSVACDDGVTLPGIPKLAVVSMWPAASEARPELSLWSGTINISASATYGNTRNAAVYGSAQLLRQSGDWWWRLSGELSQSMASGEETAKYRRGESSLEYDITLRAFVVPSYVRLEYDRFQNIDLRARAGSGAGYRLYREVDLHWQVEATMLFSQVQYRHVEPSVEEVERGTSLRLASLFQTEVLDDDLLLSLTVESFLGLDDIENTTHRVKIVLSWKLIEDLTVDFTGTLERVERPRRGDDGTLPERNDFQLSSGLGWRF